MAKETGRGIDTFCQTAAKDVQPNPELGQPSTSVRTTIRLTREEADWLDQLRTNLRHRMGRYLTYSQVVGLAPRQLAQVEGLVGTTESTSAP